MPPVELLVPLAAGERDVGRVFHDDDVTASRAAVGRIRSIGRLVFALEDASELGREAADDLVLRVDEAEADLGGVPGEGDALLVGGAWLVGREW